MRGQGMMLAVLLATALSSSNAFAQAASAPATTPPAETIAAPADLWKGGAEAIPFLGMNSIAGEAGKGYGVGFRFGSLFGGRFAKNWSVNGEIVLDFLNPNSSPALDRSALERRLRRRAALSLPTGPGRAGGRAERRYVLSARARQEQLHERDDLVIRLDDRRQCRRVRAAARPEVARRVVQLHIARASQGCIDAGKEMCFTSGLRQRRCSAFRWRRCSDRGSAGSGASRCRTRSTAKRSRQCRGRGSRTRLGTGRRMRFRLRKNPHILCPWVEATRTIRKA